MFTTRTALVSTATVVLVGLTAPASTASPTREQSPIREGTVAVAQAAPSSYAHPLDALRGLTLAQYVERHVASRLPRPVV